MPWKAKDSMWQEKRELRNLGHRGRSLGLHVILGTVAHHKLSMLQGMNQTLNAYL